MSWAVTRTRPPGAHHGAFDDRAHAELARDLGKRLGLSLVAHGRRARDHAQGAPLREVRDDGLRHRVREDVLGSLARDVHEREHGDGDARAYGGGYRRGGSRGSGRGAVRRAVRRVDAFGEHETEDDGGGGAHELGEDSAHERDPGGADLVLLPGHPSCLVVRRRRAGAGTIRTSLVPSGLVSVTGEAQWKLMVCVCASSPGVNSRRSSIFPTGLFPCRWVASCVPPLELASMTF